MDPVRNPYTPGAGARPFELVGREGLLGAYDVALERAQIRMAVQSKILYGLRGVGKTVLLQEFVSRARRHKWLVIELEALAGEPLVPALTRELFRELRNAGRTWSGDALQWVRRVFKAFSIRADPGTGSYSFEVDIEPARGYADSGDLDRDLHEMLAELAGLAGHHGVGLLLAVDELQEVERATLSALNATVHRLGQGEEPAPFLFAGAGLPSLRRILPEATSYAERLYEYWHVDRLDDAAIRDALTGPAAAQGVGWEPRALDAAVRFSGGYPYFVQVLGRRAWDVAVGPVITGADLRDAMADARQDLDAGLYAARWQRATRAEQRFMRAMAGLAEDGPVRMSDLVEALGKSRPSQLSPIRAQLISKGLVYAPDRGEVAFTVPGMGDFAARQVVD
ncbi:MAG TPA: ATP-binding protein [Actinomycetota bacterium]|nr:ATP-binding protein [Actinomycetota bacterium]